ncbi:MAG: T9SS type A sorting domain-containing protein [Bacteroidales bacterium]
MHGATVRLPGDTSYGGRWLPRRITGGATIEFETWNGYKSTSVARNGYVVYDPSTQKKEKRNIYVGEKQDFYMVSFKTDEVFGIPGEISQISCNPNPFRNEMALTMRLNNDQHIVAEIYNIQGTKIKTLLNSDLPEGYYEVAWKGDNEAGNKVKEGVYFYQIRTGNGTEVTDKIILIK